MIRPFSLIVLLFLSLFGCKDSTSPTGPPLNRMDLMGWWGGRSTTGSVKLIQTADNSQASTDDYSFIISFGDKYSMSFRDRKDYGLRVTIFYLNESGDWELNEETRTLYLKKTSDSTSIAGEVTPLAKTFLDKAPEWKCNIEIHRDDPSVLGYRNAVLRFYNINSFNNLQEIVLERMVWEY